MLLQKREDNISMRKGFITSFLYDSITVFLP